MNEAGARREPFLFGVDFELSEGFFIADPLNQQEILFEAGGVTNVPRQESTGEGLPRKVFCPHPVDYEVYREKFDTVPAGVGSR